MQPLRWTEGWLIIAQPPEMDNAGELMIRSHDALTQGNGILRRKTLNLGIARLHQVTSQIGIAAG